MRPTNVATLIMLNPSLTLATNNSESRKIAYLQQTCVSSRAVSARRHRTTFTRRYRTTCDLLRSSPQSYYLMMLVDDARRELIRVCDSVFSFVRSFLYVSFRILHLFVCIDIKSLILLTLGMPLRLQLEQ